MSLPRPATTFALSVLTLLAAACDPDPTAAPPAPDAAWTSTIEARIASTEYALVAEGTTLRGSNRAQNLHVTFDPAALTVAPRNGGPEIGVSLRAWGRESAPDEVTEAAPAFGACRADGAVDVHGACLRRVVRERPGLQEWWENRPDGLEFGFEIPVAPPGDGALVLDLEVWGAKVEVRGDEATLRPVQGEALSVTHLAAWDARGVTLPSWMEATDHGLRLLVDDTNAVGPITVDPLLATHVWSYTSLDIEVVSGAGDVNGDGYADVIAGAPTAYVDQSQEGVAVVFFGSATGLASTPAWLGQGDGIATQYGDHVAAAGDVNGDGFADVLVTAPVWGPGPNGWGRVFLYLGSASGLGATAAWTFDGEQWGATLHRAVSAGDVNGDGRADVAVAQYNYDGTFADGGLVKVFLGTTSGLGATAAWTAEGDAVGAWFGLALSAAGDANGDGYGDLLVAAPQWSGSEAREGKVYLYAGSATGLGATPLWTAEGNVDRAIFGEFVASAGDVNGDGYSDVLVGSTAYDGLATDVGGAWLYLGSAAGPSTTPSWTALGANDNARFGVVSGAGDVNGDGHADVAVGALFAEENCEGNVSVYLGGATGLASTPSTTLESDVICGLFGHSLGAAGDVDGDGFGDLVVGLSQGYSYGGEAFVFRGSPSGLATTHAWTKEPNQVGAAQGTSVASAGDVNGDAYGDVLVGAPNFDNGQTDEGRAFLYLGTATGLANTAAWTKEPNQVGANMGAAVASAGDVNGDGYGDVVIGAPGFDGGEVDEGRVYVYLGSASGLGTTAVWTGEADQAGARFGTAIAAGDVNGDGFSDLAIGMPAYDGGQVDEGAVEVFLGSATGPGASPAWSIEADQASAAYGTSVASACDVNGDGFSDLIVGAPAYDYRHSNEGLALVYLGGPTGLAAGPTWTDLGNQASAAFGASVACAGDVHQDGFDDILVGAPQYDAGETNEGRVRLYSGRAAGVVSASSWSAESNQAQAAFGTSVSSAGDVNGDGYGDVLVGAPGFDNGQSNEGRVFAWLGGSAGLATTAGWLVEPNSANAAFGKFVASAGDVNGDGYGDVIVGAPGYTGGQSGEGLARLYLGNGGDGRGRGLAVAPQTRRPGVATPIVAGGVSTSATGFTVTLRKMRGPWGRTKARLQVEVKPLGTPFDGTGLLSTTGWTNTGVGGVAKALTISSLSPDVGYHWRVRALVTPAQAQAQGWGAWKYGGRSGSAVGGHVFTGM